MDMKHETDTVDPDQSNRYRRKFLLLAAVPLVLAIAAIAGLVAHQSRALAEREIAALETELLNAKKEELNPCSTSVFAFFGDRFQTTTDCPD